MAGATERSTPRAGANFELERVEVEDGRLVVSGWWSGVRGMRFVRPALLVGGRQVLATLEHKPWAPGGKTPWTAAFPWTGGDTDLTGVALAVAPSIIVPLGPDAPALDEPRPAAPARKPAPPEPAPPEPSAAEPTASEPSHAEPPVAEPPPVGPLRDDAELIRLNERVRELESLLAAERQGANAAVAARDGSEHARTSARRERDQALAQRDEAVAERDAAVRSRGRIESQRDEVLAALKTAEAERDEARAQRDAAVAERDAAVRSRGRMESERDEALAALETAEAERAEARAQRDEALLAHGALSQHVNSQLADEDRAQPAGLHPEPAADADPDEPIGVRSIPAARMIAGDLHRPQHPHGVGASKYDVWAMRVLGTVAAVCFVLLLVMILRAFL